MILLSHERQCFSRTNTFGTTPTACIRFAILSRIETLHILLEHPYDSSATSAAQLADFIGDSQSREARILFSPLRQFQRRVAVGGSVAHLVARDTSFPLITSRGDSWRARLASVQRSVRAGPTESTVARIAVITPVTPSASFAGQDQHYGDPAAGLV